MRQISLSELMKRTADEVLKAIDEQLKPHGLQGEMIDTQSDYYSWQIVPRDDEHSEGNFKDDPEEEKTRPYSEDLRICMVNRAIEECMSAADVFRAAEHAYRHSK